MAKKIARKKKAAAPKPKTAAAKPATLSRGALVAQPSAVSKAADISVTFKSGLGQITSSLFRNGVLINLQSISSSGSIHFSDVQSGDAVSINGVCTGTADISVSVPADPESPQHFEKGNIHIGFDIL